MAENNDKCPACEHPWDWHGCITGCDHPQDEGECGCKHRRLQLVVLGHG